MTWENGQRVSERAREKGGRVTESGDGRVGVKELEKEKKRMVVMFLILSEPHLLRNWKRYLKEMERERRVPKCYTHS